MRRKLKTTLKFVIFLELIDLISKYFTLRKKTLFIYKSVTLSLTCLSILPVFKNSENFKIRAILLVLLITFLQGNFFTLGVYVYLREKTVKNTNNLYFEVILLLLKSLMYMMAFYYAFTDAYCYRKNIMKYINIKGYE